MNNYNIRRDRPKITSEEIAQRKDFDSILNNHKIMSRPFYKNPWFFGVTGMASIGLIIGGVLSFTGSESSIPSQEYFTDSAPQRAEVKMASLEMTSTTVPIEEPKKKIIQIKKADIHEKTITLEDNKQKELVVENKITVTSTEVKDEIIEPSNVPVFDNRFALQPKIAGKPGGDISKLDLIKKGQIYNELKSEIYEFEMHITTEFGSKVYRAKGDKLSLEMKNALKDMETGEEVYFENIMTKSSNGLLVELSPIRYTLFN